MTLEELVTNRDLSQKLKKVGVPQESQFYWEIHNKIKTVRLIPFKDKLSEKSIPTLLKENVVEYYSAFLAGELMKWLPMLISNNLFSLERVEKRWEILYRDYHSKQVFYSEFSDTLPNVCARCLFILIKNKSIKPEDLQ